MEPMQYQPKSWQDNFKGIDKLIPKSTWKFKEPRRAKTILKKKNKFGGLIVPDFKDYCETTIFNTG